MTDDAMNDKREALEAISKAYDIAHARYERALPLDKQDAYKISHLLAKAIGPISEAFSPSPVTPDASGLPGEIWAWDHPNGKFWAPHEPTCSYMYPTAKFTRASSSLAELEAENQRLRLGITHEDGPCYYCGEPTSSLHGNPAIWPLWFPHKEEPGVVKPHHTGCVSKRLNGIEALQAKLDKRTKALEEIREECLSKPDHKDKWVRNFCGATAADALTDKEESGNV